MREAGNRRCGAVLACLDKPPGHSAGMPRHITSFGVGVLGVQQAHRKHDDAMQDLVEQMTSEWLRPLVPLTSRPQTPLDRLRRLIASPFTGCERHRWSRLSHPL